MKPMLRAFFVVAGWSLSGACTALAQPPGAIDPPPILSITKLVVKPGKMTALVKIEAERAQVLKNAKWPRTWIASSSVTGPKQVWIFARYDSLGDLEKDQEYVNSSPALRPALDRLDGAEGELLESKREITATYQKDISYRPKFDWSEVPLYRPIVR
jgi:hypothetical protein